jgi:hypothetical protein
MKPLRLAVLIAAIATSTFTAAAGDPWDDWERLSRARCPSHHLNWIPNDSYLFLVENFDATLSRAQLRNVERIAGAERQCAEAWGGLRCQATRNFVAYKKLGLMPRFVGYACRRIQCEETAICSRVPSS